MAPLVGVPGAHTSRPTHTAAHSPCAHVRDHQGAAPLNRTESPSSVFCHAWACARAQRNFTHWHNADRLCKALRSDASFGVAVAPIQPDCDSAWAISQCARTCCVLRSAQGRSPATPARPPPAVLQGPWRDVVGSISGGRRTRDTLTFLHIPKTAGTSIEAFAHQQLHVSWGYHAFVDSGPETRGDGMERCSPWHLPPWRRSGRRRLNTTGVVPFCVLRDPADRAVSEFAHLFRVYNNVGPCHRKALNTWMRRRYVAAARGGADMDCHAVPQARRPA